MESSEDRKGNDQHNKKAIMRKFRECQAHCSEILDKFSPATGKMVCARGIYETKMSIEE